MSTALISAFLCYAVAASAGALSGRAIISVENYPDIGPASPYNPPFCGMPWDSLDLNRITAVQGLTKDQCGACLQVCGAKPYSCAYILAVDQGGKHLDLSTGISGSVIGTTDGIAYAEWTPVPATLCAGIYRNDPSNAYQVGSSVYSDLIGSGSAKVDEKSTAASYLSVMPSSTTTGFITSTVTLARATPTPTEYTSLEIPSDEPSIASTSISLSTIRKQCSSDSPIPKTGIPSQFLATLETSSSYVTSATPELATSGSPFLYRPLPVPIQYDSASLANSSCLTLIRNSTNFNSTWTMNSLVNSSDSGSVNWANRILAPYNIAPIRRV